MSDIHALSGAYAVDALDDIERAQFERHLAECPTCTAEVRSLRETAALLAETTATAPSAELRARILAGVSTVRPLPPVVAEETQPPTSATVTALEPRRRRRVVTFLAAAAAAVVIGGGGVAVVQQMDDDKQQSQYSQVMAAGDAQSFTVNLDGGASATVVRSKEMDKAVIKTHAMPDAPAGMSYALWLQHDDVMVPAGMMPEGPDNEVVLSGDAATASAVAISVEPAGDEPTEPSDDIVASLPLDT
jgi:anti-sigma-K factor RskA